VRAVPRRRPHISILLPAFDAETTLPACLRSVARQSFRDWECIVIDDGSGDRTAAIAAAVARTDNRIRVLRIGRRGLVCALNAGLELCRGRYVARMDADDLMHRLRLEEQAGLLDRRPELAAVGCRVRLFPRAALADGYRAYESWLNSIESPEDVRREAFVECPVAHPTLLARREWIAEAGYRDRGWPEDYDLVLRALAAGRRIAVLPRRRLLWRHGPQRLSRTDPAYGIDRFTACKAHFLAAGFLARTERYTLWGYGSTARALRRALLEHGKHPGQIVEMHPRRLGNRIHGALVVPPAALRHLSRRPLVVSVAGATPRRLIRDALRRLDYHEPHDFVCAA
jgi:glycosyltransferase involved in cell wall biosynthesis